MLGAGQVVRGTILELQSQKRRLLLLKITIIKPNMPTPPSLDAVSSSILIMFHGNDREHYFSVRYLQYATKCNLNNIFIFNKIFYTWIEARHHWSIIAVTVTHIITVTLTVEVFFLSLEDLGHIHSRCCPLGLCSHRQT